MIPITVIYAALGLILLTALLAAVFSLAAERGIAFHSCSGGSDFYCNTCPGQYKCPGTELGTELAKKMGRGVQQ